MAHVRTWHDLIRVMMHSSEFTLEIVLGVVMLVTTLALLVRAARAIGLGLGSNAARARARIEAQVRAQDAARGKRPASASARDKEADRALNRKLASVEVILRQSTFPGERAAASEARDRLRAQLGLDAGP